MISSDFRQDARRKLDGKWGKAVTIILAYLLVNIIISFILSLISKILPEKLSFIASLITTIIEVPLTYGFLSSFIRLYKGEDFGSFDFFEYGFSNFKRSWAVKWYTFLKMLLPVILVTVVSIIFAVFIVGSLSSAANLGNGLTLNSALTNPSNLTKSSNASISSTTAILALVFGAILFILEIWVALRGLYYVLADMIAIDHPELTAKEAVQRSEDLMKGKRAKYFWLSLSFIGWAILACLTFGIGFLWLLPYMLFATISFYMYLDKDNTPVEENTSSNEITE